MSDLNPDEQSEWDDFVQHIRLGKYDGHLQDVMSAIQFRAAGGATSFRWRLTFDDVTITEDDITLGELVKIEKALDVSWVSINPARSAEQITTILSVAMKHRTDLSDDEVDETVAAITASEATDALDQYEVVQPPLEQSTPPTI